jgi:hypothetical protein
VSLLNTLMAMLLLYVSLDRCDPELNHFLISVAYANGESLPISKVIAESLRSQKWKDITYRLLLEPKPSSSDCLTPKLQNFGMRLMEVPRY